MRHIKKHLAASLTLAVVITVTSSFEVPFPPSPSEIRSTITQTNILATSPSPTITQTLKLSSGTTAEVISCRSIRKKEQPNFLSFLGGNTGNSKQKPVLAFLHGSFHASWCWSEYYMPYFADKGYDCVALSLQGTGGTPAIPKGTKKIKISSHVSDLQSFLNDLSNKTPNSLNLNLGDDPQIILIGHSFGGLTIMKWLEQYYNNPSSAENKNINLAGVGLLCSVPPSGNGPMTLRYLFRSLKDSWKITVGFAMKKAIVDKKLCRELFFGGDEIESGISDVDLERYQSYFERDTVATIDLRDLAGKLPSLLVDKENGRAPFADFLKGLALKPFVMGASDDFIVDREGVIETEKYMGLGNQNVKIVDSPHDVMLGKNWKNGAEAILEWIEGI